MTLRTTILVSSMLLGVAAAGEEARAVSADGTVWTAETTARGLRLTGIRDGETVNSGLVSVPFAGSLRWDREIQVVVDEPSGKVILVWERRWDEETSQIHLAVWHGNDWERTTVVSGSDARNPRNALVQLVGEREERDTRTPEGAGNNEDQAGERHLEVIWWEGSEDAPEMRMVLLRLTAGAKDGDALVHVSRGVQFDFGSCSRPSNPGVGIDSGRWRFAGFTIFRTWSGGRHAV